jgi:O-antigen ligase
MTESRPSLLSGTIGWWRATFDDPRRAVFFFVPFLGFLPLTAGSFATGWYFLGVIYLGLLWLAGRVVWVWPASTAFPCLVALGYFGSTLISAVFFDNRLAGLMDVGTNLQFLFLIPLVGAVIQARGVDVWSLFLNGLRAGTIIAGMIAACQVFVWHMPRATAGMVNAILAGDIAILAAAMALVGFHRLSARMKAFALAASAAGVATAMMTQTRGALLALPLFLIVSGFNVWPDMRRRPLVSAGVGLAFILSLGAFGAFVKIPERVDRFLTSVETREAALTRDASTAHRIILWTYGLEAFADQPVLGYGQQHTVAEVTRRAVAARMPVPRHTHLHNEFLNTAVSRGIVGLVALLLLLAAPVITAILSVRDGRYGERVAFAVLLSGGYATFGLTNLILGHDQMATFFASCYLVSVVAVHQAALAETDFQTPDIRSPFA